jgi:DNA-binding transcriptional MerR regulator
MTAATFSIRQAADAAGLTTKTVRYYEQVGLIPRAARSNGAARTGGNRTYRDADIERLRFVRNARLLGIGLSGIRDLLVAADGGCPSDQPLFRETLLGHLRRIDESIGRLRTLRAVVERLVSLARAGVSGCSEAGCGCMDAPELGPRGVVRAIEPTQKITLGYKAYGKDGAS